jgi:acyl dehydratase
MQSKTTTALAPVSLAALRKLVGMELGLSSWHEIKQSRIDAFAATTEDWQFIHVDPERARSEGGFGGTIAHGFLSLSLLSMLAYEAIPQIEDQTMLMNYGFDKIRFLSPVPSGSRLRGRFSLKELTEQDKGRVRILYSVALEVEGQDRPALIAEWVVLSQLKYTAKEKR